MMSNQSKKIGYARWGVLFILGSLVLIFGVLTACLYSQLIIPSTGGQSEGTASQPLPSTAGEAAMSGLPAEDSAHTSSTPSPGSSSTLPGSTGSETPLPTQATLLPTPDSWTGTTRVNILLLGVDSSDWESPDRKGPPRSDTMIVLSVDPVSKSAAMISIPRDMVVDIPGMVRPNKINTAHRFGELYHLPGGGPGLAMRTVGEILDIPIHFYILVDFRAFERFIDEIGGVEVDIPYGIKVDPTGPNNSVVLKPGKQLLDGAKALGYARNRATGGGDFDRSRRQQQVLLAVRDRVLSLEMLPRLVASAPALYNTLSDGLQSNISLGRAIKLAWLAKDIKIEDIRGAVIGSNDMVAEQTEEGQTVYRPNLDRIHSLVAGLISYSGPIPTFEEGMQNEDPRVSIVDGSRVEGLAERTAEKLRTQGIVVSDITKTDQLVAKTKLIDYTRKVYTAKHLAQFLGVQLADIKLENTPGSDVDFMILLGYEWAWNRNSK